MDIQEKINIFQTSCQNLLKQDVTQINRNIDSEIEKQIKDELREYQEKEEFAYKKKIEKLEKDYNKQMYTLELEAKKEEINEKKNIQKDLRKEIINILEDFTKTSEYEKFFMSRVEEIVQKANTSNGILRIVEYDYERFYAQILANYQLQLEIIEDKYIGGCILEDKKQGIYIDNTILESINEKLDD